MTISLISLNVSEKYKLNRNFAANQMLKSGHFLSELKPTKVKPLFKKGDHSEFSNYRPISLVSSLSTLFEYAIFHQLFEYLSENNLLNY